MPVVFRELSLNEEKILQKAIDYWILKNQLGLLNHYHFVVGEGRWRELFLTNKSAFKLFENSNISPYSIGLGFGEFKKGTLLLSLSGASFIAKLTDKTAIVTEAGEQAFLYRRDILSQSLFQINSSIKVGQKLIVFNRQKDPLGLARLLIDPTEIQKEQTKDQIVLKNIIDLGWYLRKGG
ncbi:MAG: hypothetical protein GF308_15645 [Candidatus Heimdallarchaeota archaeon]|nr:hypothetical protein [Candidatus Heimdallarchaeota archaeon]